jgi:hypothetical protein
MAVVRGDGSGSPGNVPLSASVSIVRSRKPRIAPQGVRIVLPVVSAVSRKHLRRVNLRACT